VTGKQPSIAIIRQQRLFSWREAEDLQDLEQLRRENRILREEREILEKAAAFFARETDRNR